MNPFIHNLKEYPQYFEEVRTGKKTAEVRRADRPFAVGDQIVLHEYDGERFTGRTVAARITYIEKDEEYCKEGYVILNFVLLDPIFKVSNLAFINLFDMFCDTKHELEELRKELKK